MKLSQLSKRPIGTFGAYTAYLVDGESVRNSSSEAEEFGSSATCLILPKVVPTNEIWIEDTVSSAEIPEMILGALRGLATGSYDYGLACERAEREKSRSHNAAATNVKADPSVYVELYKTMGDIEVWLVDGKTVRDLYRTDYTQGGHGYVYRFIPNNEIWLESSLHQSEVEFILLHEWFERYLMKSGLAYEKAHRLASNREFTARRSKNYG